MKLSAVIVLAGVALLAASCGGKKNATTAGSNTTATTATTTTTTTTSGGTTTAPTTTKAAPLEKLIGNPVAGKKVWLASNCGSCHTLKAAGSTGTIGMNFDYLKPSQESVSDTVPAGGDIMPAFPSLSKKQIDDLAAFVYKSTH